MGKRELIALLAVSLACVKVIESARIQRSSKRSSTAADFDSDTDGAASALNNVLWWLGNSPVCLTKATMRQQQKRRATHEIQPFVLTDCDEEAVAAAYAVAYARGKQPIDLSIVLLSNPEGEGNALPGFACPLEALSTKHPFPLLELCTFSTPWQQEAHLVERKIEARLIPSAAEFGDASTGKIFDASNRSWRVALQNQNVTPPTSLTFPSANGVSYLRERYGGPSDRSDKEWTQLDAKQRRASLASAERSVAASTDKLKKALDKEADLLSEKIVAMARFPRQCNDAEKLHLLAAVLSSDPPQSFSTGDNLLEWMRQIPALYKRLRYFCGKSAHLNLKEIVDRLDAVAFAAEATLWMKSTPTSVTSRKLALRTLRHRERHDGNRLSTTASENTLASEMYVKFWTWLPKNLLSDTPLSQEEIRTEMKSSVMEDEFEIIQSFFSHLSTEAQRDLCSTSSDGRGFAAAPPVNNLEGELIKCIGSLNMDRLKDVAAREVEKSFDEYVERSANVLRKVNRPPKETTHGENKKKKRNKKKMASPSNRRK